MARFITRRVLWGIALLWIVSAVVFVLFYIFPSADPAALRAGRNATPQQIELVREDLGLDRPKYEQFFSYMGDVFLHFDFGRSFQSNTDVREIIFDRLPATIFLVFGAVIVWLAIAIPVGIISATRRRSLLDRTTMVSTLSLISAPVFWLGLVAMYLVAQDVGRVEIFPGIGAYQSASGFLGHAWALVLPWLVLGGVQAAIYARYIRAQMIDTMAEDYIRTARAKGVTERSVILRHGMRSAITPVVTLLGLDIGVLLAGNAILTESVFNIPGIGKEVANAIRVADLQVIQGIVLFGAFFIIIFNLLVDILYAYLDPRVRY